MPISGGDGVYTQITVAGETAWQNTGTSRYLYARRPNSFTFTTGQTLYVRVTYFDDAAGTIDLQFDAQTSIAKNSTLHTRTTRVNTGRFVDGFFELKDVRFTKSLNGSDFRIVTGTTTGAKVPVSRITLSDTPFADPDFQLAVARAWQTRYTGPAKDYVDADTLKGKVMTGYQGWFGTPNDLDDNGTWRHWGGSTMTPEKFTIDMWPDLTEYDPSILARAADVVTGSGEPAYLFSSRNYGAVKKHFRWMRKHNIDGAWLQRFNPNAGSAPEWVLRNVSQAAAEEGRIWGVEYDVSSLQDATVAAKLQADWEWLTTQFDILNDPRYVHENGKPVVFIWGLSVPDRGFSIASANAVVDYFQGQGVHVIGGLPTSWNSLSAAWKTHIEKYDGVLVWQNTTPADAAFFRNRGQDFYPHIWPGFSWAHLKKLPATPLTQYTDRAGGQFYWNKGRDWINAGGADSLFIGMFDEYDEATAIMPMTDDPPPPYTEWGRFINNQGKPSDWWMMLSDELKRMMWGQRTNTGTLPTVASLANRSNIGPEASVDLGTTDVNASLSRVQQADGNTIVETVGGKECRGNASPTTTHRYMYFNVDNAFAYQLVNGDVTIEVEYFDSADNTVLALQYDSTSTVPSNPAYTSGPQTITTTGSNTWRTIRFELDDAYFGGRQNGGSDFRLNFNGKKLNVNRVWVRLPEGKAYPFTWTNATAGPTLNWSQNGNWLGGIVGQSDPTSTVRFFPGQTMLGGTIPIANNLTGQQFNTLELSGTAASASDTTVTLSGNALSLGGTTPTITLDATKSAFDLTYDIAAPITLLGTTEVGGAGDATFRISSAIDGSGGLTKTSTGVLTLTGTNSYQGGTQLNTGTIAFGGDSLGTVGNITFLGNSTLQWSPGNTQDISSRLVMSNGVTSTLDTNGNDVSFATSIGSSSSGVLTKLGAGTLTLSAANTYLGDTKLLNGNLQLGGGDNRLPVATQLIIGDGTNSAEFDLNGWNQELAGLAIAAGATSANNSVNNSSVTPAILTINTASPSSFAGILNGNLGLAKTGADTLTLSGSNTYTDPTILSAGTLEIGGSGKLGGGIYNGAISIASAASLKYSSSATNTFQTGAITGDGSITVDGSGQLFLKGTASTSFTGGVTVTNGTLNGGGNSAAIGTGGVTLGGSGSTGASFIGGQNFGSVNITVNTPDSGIHVIGANGAGSGMVVGAITLNDSDLTLQTWAAGTTAATTVTGGVTGTGNLILNNLSTTTGKVALNTAAVNPAGTLTNQGVGTTANQINANIGANVTGIIQNSATCPLILNGANTYQGNLTVNAGLVRISNAPDPLNANPGNDASTVTIAATGATLDLTYTGTDKVDQLFIGNTPMSDGVYGNSGSFLPVIGIPQITGNGTLTVGIVQAPGFASWITGSFANGATVTNQGPNDDDDKDGIRNLIEYAIAGQDPTVSNATVGSFTGNTLSFAKRPGTSGLTYNIQESSDLGVTDDWTEVSGGSYVNDAGTISYTLTPGTPVKSFLRLQVLSN